MEKGCSVSAVVLDYMCTVRGGSPNLYFLVVRQLPRICSFLRYFSILVHLLSSFCDPCLYALWIPCLLRYEGQIHRIHDPITSLHRGDLTMAFLHLLLDLFEALQSILINANHTISYQDSVSIPPAISGLFKVMGISPSSPPTTSVGIFCQMYNEYWEFLTISEIQHSAFFSFPTEPTITNIRSPRKTPFKNE